jgi:hypothetical protein
MRGGSALLVLTNDVGASDFGRDVAVPNPPAASAESACVDSESAAGVPGGISKAGTSTGAMDGVPVSAGNELPHLGQNLAKGLQTAWHTGQIFSAGAVTGAAAALGSEMVVDGVCRAPQRLQNLAFAASALPH